MHPLFNFNFVPYNLFNVINVLCSLNNYTPVASAKPLIT